MDMKTRILFCLTMMGPVLTDIFGKMIEGEWIPGAILSVPMLAIAKIICDGVRPLAALGHFLER